MFQLYIGKPKKIQCVKITYIFSGAENQFSEKNKCRIFFPLFLPDVWGNFGVTDKKIEKGHV